MHAFLSQAMNALGKPDKPNPSPQELIGPPTIPTHEVIGKFMVTVTLLVGIALAELAHKVFATKRYADPTQSFLTGREREIISAIADTTFPPAGSIPLSGTEAGVVDYLDDFLSKIPPGQANLLRAAFLFIEIAPLISGKALNIFTNSSEEARKKILDYSNKYLYIHRALLEGVRVLSTLGYMAHPDVAKKIGCTPNLDPFGLNKGESKNEQ